MLLVYRTDLIPDLAETTAAWRAAWRELGVGEVYLVAVESFVPIDPTEHGFDAAAEFPPHQVHAATLPPDVPPNLLADPESLRQISQLVAFARSTATLAEAKGALDGVPGAQDIIITETGSPKEQMLGWLTNVDLAKQLPVRS